MDTMLISHSLSQKQLLGHWLRTSGVNIAAADCDGETFTVKFRGQYLSEYLRRESGSLRSDQLIYIATALALQVLTSLETQFIPEINFDDIIYDVETGVLDFLLRVDSDLLQPVSPTSPDGQLGVTAPKASTPRELFDCLPAFIRRGKAILEGKAGVDAEEGRILLGDGQESRLLTYALSTATPHNTTQHTTSSNNTLQVPLGVKGGLLGSVGQHVRLTVARLLAQLLARLPHSRCPPLSDAVQYIATTAQQLAESYSSADGWAKLMSVASVASVVSHPAHRSAHLRAQMLVRVRLPADDKTLGELLKTDCGIEKEGDIHDWALVKLSECSSTLDAVGSALIVVVQRLLMASRSRQGQGALHLASVRHFVKAVMDLIMPPPDKADKPPYFLAGCRSTGDRRCGQFVALGSPSGSIFSAYSSWLSGLTHAKCHREFPIIQPSAEIQFPEVDGAVHSARAQSTKSLPSVVSSGSLSSSAYLETTLGDDFERTHDTSTPAIRINGDYERAHDGMRMGGPASLLSPAGADGTMAMDGHLILQPGGFMASPIGRMSSPTGRSVPYSTFGESNSNTLRPNLDVYFGVRQEPWSGSLIPESTEYLSAGAGTLDRLLSFKSVQNSPLVPCTPPRSYETALPAPGLRAPMATPPRMARKLTVSSCGSSEYGRESLGSRLPPGLFPESSHTPISLAEECLTERYSVVSQSNPFAPPFGQTPFRDGLGTAYTTSTYITPGRVATPSMSDRMSSVRYEEDPAPSSGGDKDGRPSNHYVRRVSNVELDGSLSPEEVRHVSDIIEKFRTLGLNVTWTSAFGTTPASISFQIPQLPTGEPMMPPPFSMRASVYRDIMREMQDISHTRDERRLAHLGKMGYLELSVLALHIGAYLCRDELTSSFACQTIGNLAMITGNRVSLAQLGAIEAVVYTMDVHGSALRVQKDAVVALRHLAYENDDNKTRILDLGGVDAVISAMLCDRSAALAAQVAKQCCGALAIFAVHSTYGDAAKRTILQRGGIRAVVQAIQDHPSDVQLILAGLKAIGTLIGKPEARAVARESGCLQLCEYLANQPVVSSSREAMEALRNTLRRLRSM